MGVWKKLANCKGQKFGHDFKVAGGKCFTCGDSQVDFARARNKQKGFGDHLQTIADRVRSNATKKKGEVQATYHQHLAVETAEALGDIKSVGIYLRLFKRYDKANLLRCREWVLKNAKGNKGRLFVSVYKKFLGLDKI